MTSKPFIRKNLFITKINVIIGSVLKRSTRKSESPRKKNSSNVQYC